MAEELGLGKVDGQRPTRIQPVSAHSGYGVEEGLSWLVAAVRSSPRLSLLRRRIRR